MGWENIRVTVISTNETKDERYERRLREREEAVRCQEQRWKEQREREYLECNRASKDYRLRNNPWYDEEENRFGL